MNNKKAVVFHLERDRFLSISGCRMLANRYTCFCPLIPY